MFLTLNKLTSVLVSSFNICKSTVPVKDAINKVSLIFQHLISAFIAFKKSSPMVDTLPKCALVDSSIFVSQLSTTVELLVSEVPFIPRPVFGDEDTFSCLAALLD